ncbi:MAG: glutathione S-transferase family protein [Actinobacteria bacterium]|nr:glutathione S-transferase family protein [Actinomycetota bacterium]
MITLYNWDLSVNCYKQRLLLSILDVEYESIPVDFYPGWEHKSAEFKRINPLGHIPVIVDDGYKLRDAHAILTYLASKYDPSGRWYPASDPHLLGETAQWMLFAEGTTNTASAARLHVNLGYEFDIEVLREGAHELFRALDEHLWFREREGLDWVTSSPHPTIADLAIFPDVMLSEEGGISRLDYPAIRRWTDRVRRIEGFVVMPGMFEAAKGAPK